MKRMTAATVTSTLLSLLLATGCGSGLSGKLSEADGNSTGAAPSTNTTAGPIKASDSNIGAKGVNSHISAKQQTQAQAAVNQLVTTINQLH